MIDMHNHILFGVDDGAKTIQDSMALINYEIKNGVSSIVLTPHFNKSCVEVDMDIVMQNYLILKKTAENEKINVKLYLGNEIYFGSDFYEVLEKKTFRTLAGSDYMLIEFNVISLPKNIAEMCYEARIKGYIPIIAHVERYKKLYDDRSLLENVLKEGALMQVNASTLLNMENKEYCKFADFLLKRKLISFVASDVHNINTRGFYLHEAYKIVKKNYGDFYADKIFHLNQLKVLSNEYIDSPYIRYDRINLFSRLFRKNHDA